MSAEAHFDRKLFAFFRDLAENNDRDWFLANKERYEDHVKEPCLQLISDFGPRLGKISPHFLAIPKASGGSLFRIYRDVRFSKDKRPYKTAAGIQFRHADGKDAHAPGFYLHLDPNECFLGVGSWRPDGKALKKIRRRIAEDPAGWKRVKNGKRFGERFELAGGSLKTAPRGFDPEHPQIEDLKRKDFIAVEKLTQKRVTAPGFLDDLYRSCRAGAPFVRYLCNAVGVPF